MPAFLLLLASLQLAPEHRAFVEDEARFLLSDDARERFLALETHAERERFIARFWSRRSRAEHASRLAEADRLFGPRGRHSERGRIHQLLGPPTFRERLPRASGAVGIELWHYTTVEYPFLPGSFYLVFYRPTEGPGFRLWRPEADGVEALVPTGEPNRYRLEGAHDVLADIDPELAVAGAGLVPGESRLRSISLLAALDDFPALYDDTLVFGPAVTRTVSNRVLLAHLAVFLVEDDAGVLEAHYAVEVEASESAGFAWRGSADGTHAAAFSLVGVVSGPAGELDRFEDRVGIEVSDSERTRLLNTPLSFQGRRLVAQGASHLSIALVTEGAAVILRETLMDRLWLVRETLPAPRSEASLPFVVGETLLVPHPRPVVRSGSVIVAAGSRARPDGVEGRFRVRRDGALRIDRPVSGAAPAFVEIPVRAGEYEVELASGGTAKKLRFRGDGENGDEPPRVLARRRTAAERRSYGLARASSLVARGDDEAAFESLVDGDLDGHLAVARSLYRLRRYRSLIANLEEARSHLPPEPDVLVLLAASAAALGRVDDALAYYEGAFALSPDSDALSRAVERARARVRN